MSGGLSVMSLEENDVTRFLAAGTHLGANNVNFQMEQYVYKRRQDGRCPTFSQSLWKTTHSCVLHILIFIYPSLQYSFPSKTAIDRERCTPHFWIKLYFQVDFDVF